MIYNLILTSDGSREKELNRFFESLIDQDCKDIVKVFFVNQSDNSFFSEFLGSSLRIFPIYTGKLSLSAARNKGLQVALDNLEQGENIFAFPDDDCWYDKCLLSEITNFFLTDIHLDCLCVNVFDPDSNLFYGNRSNRGEGVVNYYNIFRYPISVGIFIKLDVCDLDLLSFNESLGAGKIMGSGEETELISDFLEAKKKVYYKPDILVFHPFCFIDKGSYRKFYKYSLGFGFLTAKFLRKGHLEVMIYFLRVLMGSLGGISWYFFNVNARNLYKGRLVGSVTGFIHYLFKNSD